MRINAKLSIAMTAGAVTALAAGGWAYAGSWVTTSPGSAVTKVQMATMPTVDSAPAVEARKNGVAVDWIGQKIAKGVGVQRYQVTRYNVATGVGVPVCGSDVTAARCTDLGVPIGRYKYAVRTVEGRWLGPESPRSARIDITAATAVLSAQAPVDQTASSSADAALAGPTSKLPVAEPPLSPPAPSTEPAAAPTTTPPAPLDSAPDALPAEPDPAAHRAPTADAPPAEAAGRPPADAPTQP